MNGMPNSKIELSLCLVQQPVVLKKQGNIEILDTVLAIGVALTVLWYIILENLVTVLLQ